MSGSMSDLLAEGFVFVALHCFALPPPDGPGVCSDLQEHAYPSEVFETKDACEAETGPLLILFKAMLLRRYGIIPTVLESDCQPTLVWNAKHPDTPFATGRHH